MAPLLALAAILATAGSAASAPAAPFDRRCITHAEGPPTSRTPPYHASDVRLGRVFFLGLGRRHRWQLRRGADGILKVPVMVGEVTPVTVTIAPIGRTRARLNFDVVEWGRAGRRVADGDGQRAVRFHACPANRPRFSDGKPLGPWTGYNGGFLVDRPGDAAGAPSDRARRVAGALPALNAPLAPPPPADSSRAPRCR